MMEGDQTRKYGVRSTWNKEEEGEKEDEPKEEEEDERGRRECCDPR